MSSAALSYTSGQPRRLSTKRRGSTASSASSLAADAAIRDFKDDRRRRNRGEVDLDGDSALGRGVDEFASNVSATVNSLGMPRWIVRALVLAGVGIMLAVAVVNTLPMLARHVVSGTATFNGKPLGRVTLNFQSIASSGALETRTVIAAADGSFKIATGEGLPSGLYAVSVRPGESGQPIPKNYLSPETSPLRFEIREDLTGMQISVRDGKQPIPKNRR
ncbi:MAG: hypothetical protein NTY17_12420 [Planctomycetia bacterium]|nr:hypothetical protein [Planctomycetia bacterium]